VFYLVLLYVITINLGYIILSTDVAVIVVVEVLLYFTGAVVKLVLVYLTIPCQFSVDDGISYFWLCELNNYRGCALKGSFFR
jgi:hypothetical protein